MIMPMVRVAGIAVVVLLACVACNALSGGDKLGVEPGNDDVQLRERSPSASTGDASDSDTRNHDATDGGTGTTSDAGFDATTTNPVTFADAFDRANGAIGNGWLEKTAGKFSLSNGSVLQAATAGQNDVYYNQIVRRPATESVLDVQLAVDFTYGANTDSDPTLFARMLPNSDTVNVLSGYTFYVYDDSAGFTREEGNEGVTLQSNNISPTLAAGTTVHVVFRVHGTDPVTLEAAVTNADGTPVISLTTTDKDPKRVIDAGQVGFGSGKATQGRWDNFEQRNL